MWSHEPSAVRVEPEALSYRRPPTQRQPEAAVQPPVRSAPYLASRASQPLGVPHPVTLLLLTYPEEPTCQAQQQNPHTTHQCMLNNEGVCVCANT